MSYALFKICSGHVFVQDDETTLSEEECIANTESNNAADEVKRTWLS